MLQVFPRGQGESREATAGDCNPEYLLWGIHNSTDYFYRGAFMDVMRGVDYLLTSMWHRIVLAPSAQVRVAASYLAYRPWSLGFVLTAHLPFFCDVAHNACFKSNSLAEPRNLKIFVYFNLVAHAPQLSVPVLLSSDGRDAICPAATIRGRFSTGSPESRR